MENVESRFWSKVEKSEPTACWPWTAARDKDGYGLFRMDNRLFTSNKIAYWLSTGQMPEEGMAVMHSCDHPWCCNPAHLSLGTYQENSQDMVKKGRKRGGRSSAPKKVKGCGAWAVWYIQKEDRSMAYFCPDHKPEGARPCRSGFQHCQA